LAALAPAYRPRRPTETVLYRVVREHLETFLEHARDTYDAPLPRYVEQELRGYLRCGVFAHGFVRAHCDACGHDLLVAFSCKARGICPSCAGRRMANTTAHLVDRVLPAVPVRHWVLSLPFELRILAAFRADVLSALSRFFVEAVSARHRARARREGVADPQCGAVTFVQRFGSSLNLHVHFHVVVLDGVFRRDDLRSVRFEPSGPPDRGELLAIARRVHKRATAWLGRQARVAADGASPAGPLQACAATALQRGTLSAMPSEASTSEAQAPAHPPSVSDAVEYEGFNLEASVRIDADDDLGRERLCRYGARPILSLERLRMLPGGRVAYRVKKLGRGRAKTRVMTPLELLARFSALIPPPRYPLVRYHGVLGPRSSWRRDVVPRAPEAKPCQRQRAKERGAKSESHCPSESPAHAEAHRYGATRAKSGADRAPALAAAESAPDPAFGRGASLAAGAVLLTPNVLSVKHWNRLHGGLLYAASPRVDWASLLRRSFDVDVLRCAGCGGRLRVLSEVTEPALVGLVLDSLGMPSEAPRTARARDPTDLLDEADVE